LCFFILVTLLVFWAQNLSLATTLYPKSISTTGIGEYQTSRPGDYKLTVTVVRLAVTVVDHMRVAETVLHGAHRPRLSLGKAYKSVRHMKKGLPQEAQIDLNNN
jgi:hypothetical protein